MEHANVVSVTFDDEAMGYLFTLSCGHIVTTYGSKPPKTCPVCGATVGYTLGRAEIGHCLNCKLAVYLSNGLWCRFVKSYMKEEDFCSLWAEYDQP